MLKMDNTHAHTFTNGRRRYWKPHNSQRGGGLNFREDTSIQWARQWM